MLLSAPVERDQDRDQKSLWQQLYPGYESLIFESCPCLVLNAHLLCAKAVGSTLLWGHCLVPAGKE